MADRGYRPFVLCADGDIGPEHLPESLNCDPETEGVGAGRTVRQVERTLIEEALRRSEGNQSIAARLLGISRQALNKRLIRQARKS